jgi:2-(1,2-epoxy-1,2-dihydrophenyl)acetyl-CoA isomerase
MSGAEGVEILRDGSILRIRIDRPERKGSLSPAAIARMIGALEAASTDDGLRAVLLASAGPDFCSGADWVAVNAGESGSAGTGSPTDGQTSGAKPRTGSIQRRLPLMAHRLIACLHEIQLPVVCAVRGWAAGLGCQLALASDFAVAAEDARFWLPFAKRGFTPDSGSTWLLPRLIGIARAKELLMLGRPVVGVDAAAWGMIHRAVPDDRVEATAEALLGELAAGPTVAFGLTKRCLHNGLAGGIVAAMEAEAMALELASRTRDFREGLAAFKERRDPDFEGR